MVQINPQKYENGVCESIIRFMSYNQFENARKFFFKKKLVKNSLKPKHFFEKRLFLSCEKLFQTHRCFCNFVLIKPISIAEYMAKNFSFRGFNPYYLFRLE